jgi:hypothetical protein
MLALSAPAVTSYERRRNRACPGSVPYRRVTGRTSRRSRLRPAYSPGDLSGPRRLHVVGERGRVSVPPCASAAPGHRAECRCGAVLLDCSCKEAALLLASEPLPSGTAKLFSTADVMNAGGTSGSFFRPPSKRPNSSSRVMQAEKTFPSSFMNRPVRTMAVVFPLDMSRRVVATRGLAGFAWII